MAEEAKKRRGPRGQVFVTPERCKGCAWCVEFCPTKVLDLSPEYNSKGYHPPQAARPEACTGCGLCGMYCPDFAIFGIRLKSVA
jgi:2-oxoglutarate ferredoxin oxidoreductase subunit delta